MGAHVPTEKFPQGLPLAHEIRAPKINNYGERWSHNLNAGVAK